MRVVVNHETYGEIVYEESFWTGKKEISVGGISLFKVRKNCYAYQCGEQTVTVDVKGSAYFGKGSFLKQRPAGNSPNWAAKGKSRKS